MSRYIDTFNEPAPTVRDDPGTPEMTGKPSRLTFHFNRIGKGSTGDLVAKRDGVTAEVFSGNLKSDTFRDRVAKKIGMGDYGVTAKWADEELRKLANAIVTAAAESEKASAAAMAECAAAMAAAGGRTEAERCAEMLALNDKDADEKLAKMPDDVRADAEAMLADPNMLNTICHDFERIGIVGERILSLTQYLVGTSRLLPRPLATVTQGITSSGKSYITERVATLLPPESKLLAHAITPQSLYYLPPGGLMHKWIVAGERSRAKDDQNADGTRALREMLSSGELRKIVTITTDDGPSSVVIFQPGPIAFSESTTVTTIFDEDSNRCLMLGTDESAEQTRAILDAQGREATSPRPDPTDTIDRHHALQRMLRRVLVAIPYADLLTKLVPANRPEARRAGPQILALIEVVATLHQRQRATVELKHGDTITATVQDYATARPLMVGPMGRSIGGDMPLATANLGVRLRDLMGDRQFTTTEVVGSDSILHSRSKVSEHLRTMADFGIAEVIEPGRGPKPSVWRMVDDPPVPGARWLPTPEALERAIAERRELTDVA